MAATNEPFVNLDTDDSFSVSSLSMTDTLDPVLPHASASVPHVDVWVRDCDDPVSLAHANLAYNRVDVRVSAMAYASMVSQQAIIRLCSIHAILSRCLANRSSARAPRQLTSLRHRPLQGQKRRL
jgi:hypothetical protein